MHYQVVRWLVVLQVFLSCCSCLQERREERSLLNTFPFNAAAVDLPVPARQGADQDPLVDFAAVAEASAAGRRCIDKIVMEEETEYDEVYECNHSYNRRCTTSYSTTYTAQQEQECEENYKKNCFIQYSPTAFQAKVQICREPLVKDCTAEGPITCSTEYQSECETIQHEHQVEDDVVDCSTELQTKCEDVTSGYSTSQECSNWPVEKCAVQKKTVSKYSPETSCRKVAVELCGPSSCPAVPGPKECYETTKTIASEKPEEECSLEPSQACKHVTRLVPELRPTESCVDVPKEVCVRSQANPRKVAKPVVKKWCYTPTAESGLEPAADSGRKPDYQQSGGDSSPPPPVTGPTCPRSCLDAKDRGVCDPRCNEYAALCGIPVCTPTTTTTTTTPRAPPPIEAVVCPSTCRPGYQSNGRCEPQCDVSECDFDPDCDEPPSYEPQVTTTTTTTTQRPTTTTTQTTTTKPTTTTTTPPACPSSCRPGFQSNSRCEVQCHTPACGFDPDCNAPVKKPEVSYLPPALDATAANCGPSQRGCRSSNPDSLVLSLPFAEADRSNRRGGRLQPSTPRVQKSAPLVLLPAARAAPSPAAAGERREANNWDLYLQSGLVARKG